MTMKVRGWSFRSTARWLNAGRPRVRIETCLSGLVCESQDQHCCISSAVFSLDMLSRIPAFNSIDPVKRFDTDYRFVQHMFYVYNYYYVFYPLLSAMPSFTFQSRIITFYHLLTCPIAVSFSFSNADSSFKHLFRCIWFQESPLIQPRKRPSEGLGGISDLSDYSLGLCRCYSHSLPIIRSHADHMFVFV